MSQSPEKVSTASCFSGRHLLINKPDSFTCSLCALLSGVFELISGWSESVYEPFRRGFFFLCSSTVFLDVLVIDFQGQVFWGLISPVQDPVPEWGLKTWFFSEKFRALEIPPDCETPQLVCGFPVVEPYFCLSYPSQCCPLSWRLFIQFPGTLQRELFHM